MTKNTPQIKARKQNSRSPKPLNDSAIQNGGYSGNSALCLTLFDHESDVDLAGCDLNKHQFSKLKAKAQKLGVTKSELLRRIVVGGIDSEKAPQTKAPSFSRAMLEVTIHSGKQESFIFDPSKNLRLRILAESNDVMILKDEYGNYYCDRAISTDTRKGPGMIDSDYLVLRQRLQVEPKFALEMLMNASIPRELLDLLPQAALTRLE